MHIFVHLYIPAAADDDDDDDDDEDEYCDCIGDGGGDV
jgi:hypothetical protein